MDAMIELARGPLFRLALAVMVLGLAYRLGVTVYLMVRAWFLAGDRDLPLRRVAAVTGRWLFPVRLMRARPAYSAVSFLFHAGLLLVAFFLAGHVALWHPAVAIPWPTLPPGVADAAALVTAVGLAAILTARLLSKPARALTGTEDVLVLGALLALVVTGLLAAHPALSPAGARTLLLAHLLLGDLVLILTPTTKIVHCILMPLTRLVFELGWHFPASSGRHVAAVLAKEDEPV